MSIGKTGPAEAAQFKIGIGLEISLMDQLGVLSRKNIIWLPFAKPFELDMKSFQLLMMYKRTIN